MSLEERMLLIRKHNLWSELSSTECEELNLVHRFMEARKGEYIYFDPPLLNRLFFIKSGYIKLGHINAEGEEVIREIIREGEIFGQFTLERNNVNGEFARVHKKDISLCAFNIDDFERILARKPKLAIRYTRQVGQKLRHAENRLANMLNRDVRTRLLGFILHLVEGEGLIQKDAAVSMENFLTHTELARMIGTTRQTVNALLNEFSALGLIHWGRQSLHIPDVKKIKIMLGVG
jgi:CRP/FNR family transcriptional regulator, cyclic AMP receptor protein